MDKIILNLCELLSSQRFQIRIAVLFIKYQNYGGRNRTRTTIPGDGDIFLRHLLKQNPGSRFIKSPASNRAPRA